MKKQSMTKVAIKNGQKAFVCSQQYDEWQNGRSGRVYSSSEAGKVRVRTGKWTTEWWSKTECEVKLLPSYEAYCLVEGKKRADQRMKELEEAKRRYEEL